MQTRWTDANTLLASGVMSQSLSHTDMVVGSQQPLNDRGADVARAAGQEHLHNEQHGDRSWFAGCKG